jgi:hypothetical protein
VKDSKKDVGEIHWGYVVVSCASTGQETVCDIRSNDTTQPVATDVSSWHSSREVMCSPLPHALTHAAAPCGSDVQHLRSATKFENHRMLTSETREDIFIKTSAVDGGSRSTSLSLSSTQQQQQSAPNNSRGVYFAKDSLDFGAVTVGSLKRLKATLCNATNDEVCQCETHHGRLNA